jgi:hypothetical protein
MQVNKSGLQFIFASAVLTVVFGFLAYYVLRETGLGGGLFRQIFVGKASDYRVDPSLIATYIEIIGVVAIGYAGAWVAIKIADSSARTAEATLELQAQANRIEERTLEVEANRELEELTNNSVNLFRALTLALIETFRAANELKKQFDKAISSQLRKSSSYYHYSEREALEELSSLIMTASTQVNLNLELELFIKKLNNVCQILVEISEDKIASSIWKYNVEKIDLSSIFLDFPSAVPFDNTESHSHLLEIDLSELTNVRSFLIEYSAKIEHEHISKRLSKSFSWFEIEAKQIDPHSTNVIQDEYRWSIIEDAYNYRAKDVMGIVTTSYILNGDIKMLLTDEDGSVGAGVKVNNCLYLFCNIYRAIPTSRTIVEFIQHYLEQIGYKPSFKSNYTEFSARSYLDEAGVSDAAIKDLVRKQIYNPLITGSLESKTGFF